MLLDYLNFHSLRGRYENGYDCLIPDLFEERIPEEVIDILKPGDPIFCHSKKSLISWLIMYYCHLPVSHVSMYVGDRNIIHATRDRGVVQQKIDELFDRNLRFLPCKLLLGDERKNVLEEAESWIETPYTYRYIIPSWIYIISGRNWGTFKWKFYFDFLILAIFLDIICYLSFNKFGFVFISLIHVIIILFFSFLWKFNPIPFDTRFITLNMLFANLLFSGRLMLLTNLFYNIDDVEVVGIFREKE